MSKKYQKNLENLNPERNRTASEALITGISQSEEDKLSQTQLVVEIIDHFKQLSHEHQKLVLKDLEKINKKTPPKPLSTMKNLTIDEAASYIGVETRTIYNWLKKDLIHGEKKRGKWIFSNAEVRRIISERNDFI